MIKYLFIFLTVFIISTQNISAIYAYGPMDEIADEMRRMRQLQEMQMLMQMQRQQAPPQAPRQSEEEYQFVVMFQRGLAASGYYSGPIDGIWGPRSQAALDASHRDNWRRDPEGYCARMRQMMEKGMEIGFHYHRQHCLTR